MYTIDELKNKIIYIHGNKYEYDFSTYKTTTKKMCIICPIHGDFFMDIHTHLKGQGCPKCGIIKRSQNCKTRTKSSKVNSDEYVKRCNDKFNCKFTYDMSEFVNLCSKIKITCPEHGEFTQIAYTHLNSKCGCPKCSNKNMSVNQTKSTDSFIKKAIIVHGNKYDYTKVNYINSNKPINIICKQHGEFKQLPFNHLSGNGCPICGIISTKKYNTSNTYDFISKSKNIHGDKYDYSKVKYINNKEKVCIICPKHGEFLQTPDDHLQGKGCSKCANQISKPENEIYQLCNSYIGENNVIQRERELIKPYELDIYIPSLKFAIEYNGLRWHSEKYGKDKKYHLNKLNFCKNKGVKLLQIFEDEYISNRDIVFNKIKHILHVCNELPKIMGRKCIIKEINKEESELFLNKYHIQGFVRSTTYLGAFYNDNLIAVMTFKKEEKNGLKWELNRFASDYHYICQGVGGKLFKYFIKSYSPNEIKSFADRRWTIDEKNNIYIQLGFKFDSYTPVEYRYFKESDGIIRQHKFNFRKDRLNRKFGLPLTMTENEMTSKLGYTKIWDCGLIKYVWKKD